MSDKVYLFNLKPVTAAKPHVRRARLYRDKLEPHWTTDDQGREYLDVTIFENAEPDRFGNTAAAVLDTYWRDRPAGAGHGAQPERAAEPRGRYVPPTTPSAGGRPAGYVPPPPGGGGDDLPF